MWGGGGGAYMNIPREAELLILERYWGEGAYMNTKRNGTINSRRKHKEENNAKVSMLFKIRLTAGFNIINCYHPRQM